MVRRLYSFLMVTLDGFYEGPNQEFDFWTTDQEFYRFAAAQLHDSDLLIFGRVTYEGMAGYWPTQGAREDDPVIAELMNTLPKVVVSTTLTRPTGTTPAWSARTSPRSWPSASSSPARTWPSWAAPP
jgi:dihydrofolate reductase